MMAYLLSSWIGGLQQTDKLILVEGQKDKAALEQLGITSILTVSKTPTYKTIETIQAKEVIILTDLDNEGKKLYSTLRHHLQKRGVKIDTTFREFLFKETHLTHIEGLPHYLRNTTDSASKIGTRVFRV